MNLKTALGGGGALLAAVAFVGGTLFGGSGAPDAAIDAVQAPASRCPDGWKDTSVEDEHAKVFSCVWGDHIVYLNGDMSFNYSWDGKSPEFNYDASKVPAWR